MQAQILAPAAVLIAWSLVMVFWIAFARFPAIARKRRELTASGEAPPETVRRTGVRGQDLEGFIPDRANWPAHNFTHLMEQPTLFYAAVVILAIMGAGAGDVLAAWIYVVLRILHSIWQATVNRIPVRFALFMLSSFALIWLAVSAIIATLFHDPGVL